MENLNDKQNALTSAGINLPDIKPEVDGSLKLTALPGFEVVHTGGGCKALRRDANGFYTLLTSECGSDVPDEEDWEENLIGVYRDADDEEVLCLTARELLEMVNAQRPKSGA